MVTTAEQRNWVVGDANGDGRMDLVVEDFLEGTNVYRVATVDENRSWSAYDVYGDGIYGCGEFLKLEDLDGDGLTDLLCFGGTVALRRGDGAGNFEPTEALSDNEGLPAGGYRRENRALTDLDQDGLFDMVVGCWRSELALIRQNRPLEFAVRWIQGEGETEALASGDFNGDGYPDVATVLFASGDASEHGGAGILRVRPGNGTEDLGEPLVHRVCEDPLDMAVGNVDGDAIDDLVIACWSSDYREVLLNPGTEAPERIELPSAYDADTVAVGDLDGDGDADVVVNNFMVGGEVSVYENLGDGRFASEVVYSLPDYPAG